jgi:hypothetical protein
MKYGNPGVRNVILLLIRIWLGYRMISASGKAMPKVS